MDIKGIVRNISPFSPSGKVDLAQSRPSTDSKTDANNDREGNGQASDGEQKGRRSRTPEEIQQAVAQIEALSGIKEHGLTVRVESRDGITTVFVEDREGKIIRRIPESELSLMPGQHKRSGNLLNKAL
jgi:uncharacterized FlaG/YvyC family protein